MTVDSSSAPRPGPRPSTSRQEIVQCTLRMLDREGAEALSFRAVARELGITVGALSRYFKSLADVQDEVAASIMSEVRPLDAKSKLGLREQLVRFGTDMLEINRAHPYLLKINGPASAAVVGRNTRQCVEAMQQLGVEFELAVAIYSLVGNLAYAWGVSSARQDSPELQARIVQAYLDEVGELAPGIKKMLAGSTGTAVYRRWLLLYIDGLLPAQPVGKRR